MSRDALVSRLRLMGVALPAIFVVSVLFGSILNTGFSWYIAYASIGTATVIGLPIFAFELFYVNSPLGVGFRRWPFARFIIVRFALWCAWIFIATHLSNHWFGGADGPLLGDGEVWWTIVFSFAVGFSVVLSLTLNRLIGPGVFRSFLLGRYHTPREEERALLFIDLAGSTAIAERIGATRFLELMNEFVHDVGVALEGSGGVIYQYVGDEAIITWRLDRTRGHLRRSGRRPSPARPGRGPRRPTTGADSAWCRPSGPRCMPVRSWSARWATASSRSCCSGTRSTPPRGSSSRAASSTGNFSPLPKRWPSSPCRPGPGAKSCRRWR